MVKFQFLPQLVEVPLQSWVHLILEVMVKAFENIHWHGIEERHQHVMWICVRLTESEQYGLNFPLFNDQILILVHPSNHFYYIRFVASNLHFVESPAGVGWSYQNTSSDCTCVDASAGKRIGCAIFSFKSIIVCPCCTELTVSIKNIYDNNML